MNKEYHQYTTSIPPVYHQYTTSIPSVYHQYDTSIPPVHHQYTMVYVQYTMVYGQYTMVYSQYTTSIPQRPLQVWIRDFVFTWWCNETFINFSLKIALHCIALHCTALHCIALHCIVQSEAHFNLIKADSTEIYESSMNLFFSCV